MTKDDKKALRTLAAQVKKLDDPCAADLSRQLEFAITEAYKHTPKLSPPTTILTA